MRRYGILFTVVFVCILALATSLYSGEYQETHQVIDRINRMQKSGEISEAKALAYKFYLALDRSGVPEDILQGATSPLKCATPIVAEVQEKWSILAPEDRQRIEYLLNRSFVETRETYVSPDGHYNLHYSTSGSDAVPSADYNNNGIPDYVEDFADYFDTVWQTEIVNMGYNAPYLGSNNMQEVYIENLSGVYGYVSGYDNLHVDNDYYGFPPNDDPDGDQAGAMKVTAAHEFHHEIQYTYTVSSSWYMEATSTFMEDVVFDQVNDYYWYLDRWYNNPWIGLTVFENGDVHQYSACIWNHYLRESFGVDIIREIWEYSSANALTAIINVLQNNDTSVEDEFQQFETWNYYTGNRSGYGHETFSEASNYPLASMQATHYFYASTQGFYDQSVPSNKYPQKLACNYLRFINYNQQSDGILLVRISGNSSMTWGGYALTDSTSSHAVSQYPIIYENGYDGIAIIPGWSELNNVVVVPTVISTSGSNVGYSYTYSAEVVNAVVFLSDFEVSELSGNGNGSLESDETGQLVVYVDNYGNDLNNVSLTITTDNPDITITNGDYTVGNFAHNSSTDNSSDPFVFQLGSDVEPQEALITLHIFDSSGEITTEEIRFNIGFSPVLFVDDDNGTDDNDVILAALDSLGIIFEARDVSQDGLANMYLTQREKVIWSAGAQTGAFSSAEKDSLQALFNADVDLLLTGIHLADQLSSESWLPITLSGNSPGGWLKGVNNDLMGESDQNWLWITAPLDGNEQIGTNGDPRAFVSFAYINTELGGVIRYRDHGRTAIADFPFSAITQQNSSFLDADDFLQIIFDYFDNDNRLPAQFNLMAPAYDSLVVFTSQDQTVSFQWEASSDNEDISYILLFTQDSIFPGDPLLSFEDITSENIDLTPGDLDILFTEGDSISLFWGVIATDGKEPRLSESIMPIRMKLNIPNQAPAAFQLLQPADGGFFIVQSPDDLFSFEWSGSLDPEGDPVSYLWKLDNEQILEAPYFREISTGDTSVVFLGDSLLSWLPEGSDTLQLFWSVSASDGELTTDSDTNLVTIVKAINYPPTATEITEPASQSVFTLGSFNDSLQFSWNVSQDYENDPLEYTLSGFFGDSLIFTLTSPDTFMVLSGEEIFSFFPEGVDTMMTVWRVDVTDGITQVASEPIGLMIIEGINEPPSLFSLLAPVDFDTLRIYADSDTIIRFRWEEASDPDGDILQYTWYLARVNDLQDTVFLQTLETSATELNLHSDSLYNLMEGLPEVDFFWNVNASDGEYQVFSGFYHLFVLDITQSAIAPGNDMPSVFKLHDNFPNPFNPETIIRYEIPVQSRVKLIVYDLTGHEISRLVDEIQDPGVYNAVWRGVNDQGKLLPSGVYFYRLETDDFSVVKKMILVR